MSTESRQTASSSGSTALRIRVAEEEVGEPGGVRTMEAEVTEMASTLDSTKLRIRVAELCPDIIVCNDGEWFWVPRGRSLGSRVHCINNDPLCDLNACHEFEKQAPMGYADAVRYIVAHDAGVAPQPLCDQYLIHASAEQRCRAFVAVMEAPFMEPKETNAR